MNKDTARINELTLALQNAEQRLTQRETLVTTAISQTETVRSQYEQANERAVSLRRQLDAKDEQLTDLQSQLEVARAELAASRGEVIARDERIAALEQLHLENDNALDAIHQDAKRQSLANPDGPLAAMNVMLESLDDPSRQHRILRSTTTLGRAPANDIAINSTSVSRYHARMVFESDEVVLIDLQSTNGCSINGRRVSRQSVHERDVIGIGDAKFRLTIGTPLSEFDDTPMSETHVLLNDSAIFVAAHGSEPTSARQSSGPTKPKN
jgi:pSer/pThr/pTyr-binding forkhead associated (FHA) protein